MADQGIANLDRFARAIRKSPERADKALGLAVDEAAEFALKAGIDRIAKGYNLERGYIEKNLQITQTARQGDPTAKVSGRKRPTTLRSYGGNRIKTTRAKSPGRKLKGDRRRGIAKGQKAAGIRSFQVTKSKPATEWPGGFIVYGKKGNVLMMTRHGPGKKDIETRYGPSVGSAWQGIRNEVKIEALKVIERSFDREFKRLK